MSAPKTPGMWHSWMVEDLSMVGGLIQFLLRLFQCYLDHYFRNISSSIDNCAKYGGEVLFTKMNGVLLTKCECANQESLTMLKEFDQRTPCIVAKSSSPQSLI